MHLAKYGAAFAGVFRRPSLLLVHARCSSIQPTGSSIVRWCTSSESTPSASTSVEPTAEPSTSHAEEDNEYQDLDEDEQEGPESEAWKKSTAANLLRVAKLAAEAGAKVVTDALGKQPAIRMKGATDLVTETDEASEKAILEVIREHFPTHAVLGEEGGVTGDVSSRYLWCVDPLDGTTNFAHQFPSFAVSVGVMRGCIPQAGCVVEFAGGPGSWVTRTYAAAKGCGATMNGQLMAPSRVSKLPHAVMATGFGYDHNAAWKANIDTWKDLSILKAHDQPRGLRRLGAASVDLCHVACGMIDAYWEYQLKPWDTCAGVIIAEEAGARVTTMANERYSPFHRSVLATCPSMHTVCLRFTKPQATGLDQSGAMDCSPAFIPEGYNAGFAQEVIRERIEAAEKRAIKKAAKLAAKQAEAEAIARGEPIPLKGKKAKRAAKEAEWQKAAAARGAGRGRDGDGGGGRWGEGSSARPRQGEAARSGRSLFANRGAAAAPRDRPPAAESPSPQAPGPFSTLL